MMAVVKAAFQHYTILLCGGNHPFGLLDRCSQWLFTQYMLSQIHCRNANLSMEMGGSAHNHHINVLSAHRLLPVLR